MTNKRTFKFQFSTLVIIALIAMLTVGCKNKSTAIDISMDGNNEVYDEAYQESVSDIKNFEGNSYKSGNHSFKKYQGMIYFYTAEVQDNNLIIERYNAATGEKNGVSDGYPQKYSSVGANGKYTLTHQNPKSKLGYNITIDGEIYLVNGGTAIFDEDGLTILFTEGGSIREVRFAKR